MDGGCPSVADRPSANVCRVGRVAAVVAATCAAAHLGLIVSPPSESSTARFALALMAVGCVVCIGRLWSAPTLRAWRTTMSMYAAMLIVHFYLLHPLLDTAHPSSGDDVAGHQPGAPVLGEALMATAHLLPALELLLCASVAIWLTGTRPGAGARSRAALAGPSAGSAGSAPKS